MRLVDIGIQLKYPRFPVCRWRQMLQVMMCGDALWWCRLIISQSYLERTIIAIRKSLPMNASNQFAIMERSRDYIAVSSSERFFIWSRLFAGWCHGSKVLTRGSWGGFNDDFAKRWLISPSSFNTEVFLRWSFKFLRAELTKKLRNQN